MSAEFEQLVAQFEQFQSKIKKMDDQFANLGRLRSEIAELETRATSADGSLTVVAGPDGSIKDIQLTDKALDRQPQALSSVLLATIQEAVAEAARKQAGIVDEHMGGQLNTTDQVIETQAELFGTSPEELRTRMGEERSPRPATPEEEYHEDYSQRDILGEGDEPHQAPPPPPASGGSAGETFLRDLFDDGR